MSASTSPTSTVPTRRSFKALGTLLALAALGTVFACGGAGFESKSKVDSVRVFAARADKPYAKPGETVNLEVLAYDGRANPTRPMRHYFLPFTCLNPTSDSYVGCFVPGVLAPPDGGAAPGADAGAGGGASGGFLSGVQDGTDLTPILVQGTRYSYKVPASAVITRKETPDEPYGLTIVFTVACAGRVVFKRPDLATRQQVPLACVDEDGVNVPPQDYVLGIHRVYIYDQKTNENPVLQGLTVDGKPVDPNVGIEVDRCLLTKRTSCPELKLDVVVPETSWQVQDGVKTAEGTDAREQIWVDYYATQGDVESARLVFDVGSGRVPESAAKLTAGSVVGEGTLFAVLHDNRGGVAWTRVPFRVK
jgi:hypothetical protein